MLVAFIAISVETLGAGERSFAYIGSSGSNKKGRAAIAAAADLDRDRVGVFWALLFLSSQGRVELDQEGWLHGPLRLKFIPATGTATQLPIRSLQVPDASPTRTVLAA